ncbi:methyltransferase domain-containing protein [Candidatus Pacearchaeota archaeon]|nr:methyltransferase domain-containing protein [Candidatus Pacearchaeota archaeon]
MGCRFCNNPLENIFIELGNAPPTNSFRTEEQLNEPEIAYPLRVFVCDKCFLVQVDEHRAHDEIFGSEYVYFSSVSQPWLEHCKKYADFIIPNLNLNNKSQVIEIASNDGYLLQYFKEKEIPVLGIEPSSSTAKIAIKKGIPTIEKFFGTELAEELVKSGTKADLLIGNNVLAHVPNVNDFVRGLEKILGDTGVLTMEFPHLKNIVEQNQFDTIYQEHYSYFSFSVVKKIFSSHRLELFDVEEIPTHGGSLRIYAKHKEDNTKKISNRVNLLEKKEIDSGMMSLDYYNGFALRVDKVKYDLLKFLIEQKENGKTVVGYGAAAKGNTLLNYCGIRKDLISYVADLTPFKQGKYLPESHIPVVGEEKLRKTKPDNILILPWNFKDSIKKRLEYTKEWGAKLVVPIPRLEII